eukprot:12258987-Prorocentrum_lima.AAC.1
MTSSLVGSEMCIRDRLQGNRDVVSKVCNIPRMPMRKEVPVCTSKGSVSYTHLTLPTICSV